MIGHKKIVCLTLVICLIKIYIYILKKLIVWVCFGFVLSCLFYLFLLQNTFPDDDGSVTEIKDADLNSSGSAVKVFSKFGLILFLVISKNDIFFVEVLVIGYIARGDIEKKTAKTTTTTVIDVYRCFQICASKLKM